jgi:hypothetical protein
VKPVGSIVIAAALAQRPNVGGHTWFALQYLLGFRKLGWEVLLVDRLDAGMCRDRSGDPCSPEGSANLAYLEEVMEQFELADSWSALLPDGQTAGLSRAEVERRVASSDLLFNVMGYLDDEALLAAARLRVFLDIDPGFGQMWRELGLSDLFSGHDRFVSVGLNVGSRWHGLHHRGQLARVVCPGGVRRSHLRPARARVPPLRRAPPSDGGKVRDRALDRRL